MIKFQAPANIALLKYWGKENDQLIIPTVSSISMTLAELFTTTTVEKTTNHDTFILNGQTQDAQETAKISRFIDLFRQSAKCHDYVKVTSENNFPTAAGLASSASGFAALAGALNLYYQLNLSYDELSIFARKGSGSAARSLHGGFVVWDKGSDDKSSRAYQLDAGEWDIHMIIIVCNKAKKQHSSTNLMALTKQQSIFYSAWVKSSNHLFQPMKQAILNHNFMTVGSLARRSAWQMHATTLGLDDPFFYLQSRSFQALAVINQLKAQGIQLYETMDAGPNIKVLVQKADIEITVNALKDQFNDDEIIVTGVGKAAKEIV